MISHPDIIFGSIRLDAKLVIQIVLSSHNETCLLRVVQSQRDLAGGN